MQSEFYNVALDRVRYSLVWEDAETLYNALDISSNDHLLIITSAGCNVFNALLKNPASVTAIDLNPIQNNLLELKKHIILHHDYSVFRSCLGLDGTAAVTKAWEQVQRTLPAHFLGFWSSFFEAHPEGLLTAGRLESYITSFYQTLSYKDQQKLQHLLTFKKVEDQYNYFDKELHNTSFSRAFIEHFNDQNLSKGRDPKLFKYADESGGEAFYNRLVKQISSSLVCDNFYFRFFFFGPLNIPEHLLPPCYQQQHFHLLKAQLDKVSIVTTEAINYLLSANGQQINKASLSNIFEYTSIQEFELVCKSLYQESDRQLRIVYWNLLHEQGDKYRQEDDLKFTINEGECSKASCFYFKDVRIIENTTISVHQPKLITTHE